MPRMYVELLRQNVSWLTASLTIVATLSACAAEGLDSHADLTTAGEMGEAGSSEIGQTQQAWWSWSLDYNAISCFDPTGTDSVLAALAVATASELRRWQPTLDFYVSGGSLQLTPTGKQRCADGECFNTQALLDMQKSYSRIEVRPGVDVSPSLLRLRLTYNHEQQAKCTTSFWNRCSAPSHEFRFLHSEQGPCDMNYWFEVVDLQGNPLTYRLRDLEEKLIWVDVEDNSYIRFQVEGSTISIDPTYGLNESGSSTSGSCSAACTKVSSSDLTGQCCACNGTKKYQRSTFSSRVYLCR